MILVIANNTVLATHRDNQQAEIRLDLYPTADTILRIDNTHHIRAGDPHPAQEHPEWILEYLAVRHGTLPLMPATQYTFTRQADLFEPLYLLTTFDNALGKQL